MIVVRVLMVDDQAPFLRAMSAVVEETAGFEVVGEASSGRRRSWRPVPAPRPGADGRQPSRHRRAGGHPAAAGSPVAAVVLLLSTYDEDAGERFLAECGAAAYVTKSAFGPGPPARGMDAATS